MADQGSRLTAFDRLGVRTRSTRAHNSLCCLPSVPSHASRRPKKRNTSSPATNRQRQISSLLHGRTAVDSTRRPDANESAELGYICGYRDLRAPEYHFVLDTVAYTRGLSSCYTDLLIYRRARNISAVVVWIKVDMRIRRPDHAD
jgi:hypothetical protein